jgi:hypothetical protein
MDLTKLRQFDNEKELKDFINGRRHDTKLSLR